jgi:flagellar basal-body rod protein FlgB
LSKPFTLVDTSLLEQAMNASALRGQVISANIANIHNPDYKAKAVLFESKLREAVDASPTGSPLPANLKPEVVEVKGSVDIHTEMASLAKNQILYNAYSNRVAHIYSQLKWIIENAGR